MMRAARKRQLRGFTLIELLVSLTGGLFVSLAVYALARDASRFYQREGRQANATLAAVVGFDRLRADIARAGFLITPNIQTDPFVCTRPEPTATELVRNLSAVQIVKDGSPSSDAITANAAQGFVADALWLAGSYSSPDEFPISGVDPAPGGAGFVVTLQLETGAMARLGWATADATKKSALIASLFVAGRGLRIRDTQGDHHYGVIQGSAVTADGLPQITLGALPALTFRQDQTKLCGITGGGMGSQAAIVNFIRYDIRSLNDGTAYPAYASLFAASSNSAIAEYEKNRTELVRTELDANVNNNTTALAIDGVEQTELATEYAVGLEFGITAITANPDFSNPSVAFVDRTDEGTFKSFANSPTTSGTPQHIHAVRVRLAVRSREPDRESSIAGGRFRIGLNVGGGNSGPFARVRTLQADVALHNNEKAKW